MNAAPAPVASFHAGERALQQQAGVAERMADIGPRVIRHFMPEQHRSFFTQLPFLLLGSLGPDGQPWASVLAQPPGFVQTPDDMHLRIDALPQSGDPLAPHLQQGARLGLLGIEPHTRRRNRVNATVTALDSRGFTLRVEQSFGNCPKYIQAREPVYQVDAAVPPPARHSTRLDAAGVAWLRAADTFFIASAHPQAGLSHAPAEGVDVSHRGGKPGFVQVHEAQGQQWLTVPDFMGNFFFNTLGNLAAHPQAGLLFIDYDTGDLLQLAVHTALVWDGPELAHFAGAQRLLRMRVDHVLYRPAALPLRWGPAQISPALEGTGTWGLVSN
jgi:predicted pyridoxine 5'-phosphate oxidase superfamily flavin-nucleotide-binding protein